MHVLRSTAIGTEIIDSIDHHIHGRVGDILIDSDRGKIIALLVDRVGFSERHALMTQDVESWGNRVHVRDAEVMGEVSDFVRLVEHLKNRRPLVGQNIRTKSGQWMGRCADVQFRTDTFDLEWIFPRKFLRKSLPLPVSEILEVTTEAIIIKDQGPKGEEVPVKESVPETRVEPVIAPTTNMNGDTSSHKTL